MTSSPPPSSVMAAFDLPAMPPSFEDFQFSLNLPENITPSDFNLVSSPEFSNLFGIPSMGSGPFTPSALIASSTGSTPKGSGMMGADEATDDTIMTSSASRRPSISSALGLGLENQMNVMPTHTSVPQQQQQQPPAAPAEVTLTFEEYMARNARNAMNSMMPQQQQQQQQHQQQQQGIQPGRMEDASKSLFDANESNFLTNFLQGFEGWDFNPNLPLDLPSFAEAERGAYAYGMPPSLPPGLEPRRHSRKSTNGSKGKNSPSAALGLSHTNSPSTNRIESSAGAAFGRPMADWNEDEGEGDSKRDSRGRRKGSHHIPDEAALGKKVKVEHGDYSTIQQRMADSRAAAAAAAAASKKDQLSDHDKRQNHILSEQRRRNHIREAFKELVDLLEAGREFGARGLGMSSGAGTGVEDEGLDDRSDYESTLEDEEASAATKRRKAKAKRKAAMEAILSSGGRAGINGGSAATRGRGKGRGRGGSAGGGAGSKSAVLFQAVDLLRWLEGRNQIMDRQVQELEEAAPAVKAA